MPKHMISLVIVSSLGLGACQGAIWGNLGVLVLAVGIFCGTILLGHPR